MLDKLIDLLVTFARLFKFWVIVNADEACCMLRLGLYKRTLAPGIHWMWPFRIHEPRFCRSVQGTMRLMDQSLTTTDGHELALSAILTFRVIDPQKYLVTMDGASAVDDLTYGAVSEWIHKNERAFVLNPTNWADLCKKIRNAADDYGIYVVRVRFGDLTRAKALRLLGNSA